MQGWMLCAVCDHTSWWLLVAAQPLHQLVSVYMPVCIVAGWVVRIKCLVGAAACSACHDGEVVVRIEQPQSSAHQCHVLLQHSGAAGCHKLHANHSQVRQNLLLNPPYPAAAAGCAASVCVCVLAAAV